MIAIYQQKGFIALTSAIIISVLLLAITVSLGFSGFFTRLNILDSESKERSVALAEACIDTAILKLANSTDYVLVSADHVIPVGTDTCNIISLAPNPSRSFPITIQTQACINKSVTNLEVIIDDNLDITSYKELPYLSSSTCP